MTRATPAKLVTVEALAAALDAFDVIAYDVDLHSETLPAPVAAIRIFAGLPAAPEPEPQGLRAAASAQVSGSPAGQDARPLEEGGKAVLHRAPDGVTGSAIRRAAIMDCERHADMEHVNQIPPCAGALQDARYWADLLVAAREAAGE